MGRLDGKVALITGGASGMGMVASKLFASEGAAIVLTDVADDAGEAVASEIEPPEARRCTSTRTCRTRPTRRRWSRRPWIASAGSTILYNNAGVMMSQDGSVHRRRTSSVWDTTLGINVKGVAFGCKYGVPAMIASGGGSIINVASFVAWMGAATSQTAYTASKGAVLSMTREIAVEYARKGIRCNALCPGPIDTPLLAELLADPARAPAAIRPHPDGAARAGGRAREGGPVPGQRRLLVHDGGLADRRRGITAAYVTPED